MDKHQRQLYEALGRVEEFLDENKEKLGGVFSSATHQFFLASRERVVARFQAQERAVRSARRGVAAKHELREQLVREHLRPIAAAAQALVPNVRELPAFSVPASTRPFTAFVAAGHGMAEAAKARESEFTGVGFAPDFVTRLLAATDALERSITASSQISALRVEATSGLEADGKAARKALRLLDAMIRAAVKERALLDRWTHLRRVAAAAASAKELSAVVSDGTVGVRDGSGDDEKPSAEAPAAA